MFLRRAMGDAGLVLDIKPNPTVPGHEHDHLLELPLPPPSPTVAEGLDAVECSSDDRVTAVPTTDDSVTYDNIGPATPLPEPQDRDRVQVVGLLKRPDLNDRIGSIQGDAADGRWAILLDPVPRSSSGRAHTVDPEQFKFKRSNFVVLPNHPAAAVTVQPPRARLPCWVTQREAVLFQIIAQEFVRRQPRDELGDILKPQRVALCEAVEQVLDLHGVTTVVTGSKRKETATTNSDTDVLVHTPSHTATCAEKKKIIEQLQQKDAFLRAHIRLKGKVIFCATPDAEIEFIFVGTDGYGHDTGGAEDYGHLPGSLETKFQENPAAQNAARMLKWGLQKSHMVDAADTMPSFILETLTIEAQDEWSDRDGHGTVNASQTHADGSMQIFCEALQMVVDAGAPQNKAEDGLLNSIQHKWFEKPQDRHILSASTQASVFEYAQLLLQRFCVSRV